MTQPRRGRPPHPLDPDASHAARLGAEIRARRQAHGLTLEGLAALIGFSPQLVDSSFEGLGRHYATRTTVLAGEARCWLWLGHPSKAVDAAQRALARDPIESGDVGATPARPATHDHPSSARRSGVS
jgi:hypothetical protein